VAPKAQGSSADDARPGGIGGGGGGAGGGGGGGGGGGVAIIRTYICSTNFLSI
jgi:hypothetical protein